MDVRQLGATQGAADAVALSGDDLAMMQFTSGSTGQPKGVLLTHANLLCNALGVIGHTGLSPQDRLLHVMPLYHTNGVNNQLVAPFIAGASVALVERFRAEDTEEQIARYRPTYMTGVPTMYARIVPHLRIRRSARRCASFAAARRRSRSSCTSRSRPRSACRWWFRTACRKRRAPRR
jgi:acyl-CoA synthetase (AMP-forming)/AMP-acid ligase II